VETLDQTLEKMRFGTVEAVKTVSDLFCHAGEIVEFNDALEGTPEAVNADPYGAGWMIKLKLRMLRIMILYSQTKHTKNL
jgi:glycine cleavage system H protein